MGFQLSHFATILKISLGHCGPLTPTLQFRHLSGGISPSQISFFLVPIFLEITFLICELAFSQSDRSMQPFTGTVLHFFNAFPPSSPRHLSGGISPSQISWFFSNRISQDHISDLLTGISSVFSSSLLVAILLCWLSFISPLYLHLLILASRNASNCACSLTFRWGFDGRQPVTRPMCSSLRDELSLNYHLSW